jgi:acid stress-induced BolA-like protein IbaG/YrbA
LAFSAKNLCLQEIDNGKTNLVGSDLRILGGFVVTPEQVKSYIAQGLECQLLEVAGDGQHFEAVIVSPLFRGKSRVQQHQLVYAALGERMREEVHALSLRTFTPEDWQAMQQ